MSVRPNPSRLVRIDYTNHRGVRSQRFIYPLRMTFTSNQWHPELQWIVEAIDYGDSPDKQGMHRTFTMKDIHSWVPQAA